MAKKRFGTLLCVLLVIIAAVIFWVVTSRYQQHIINVNGFQVSVLEPRTAAQYELGLGGRKELAENQGMLFIFPTESLLAFWMKGMLIPIDIIWLDSNCKVVHIEANLPPCPIDGVCPVYRPANLARYVLETKAGFSQRHQIIVGTTIIPVDTCTQ